MAPNGRIAARWGARFSRAVELAQDRIEGKAAIGQRVDRVLRQRTHAGEGENRQGRPPGVERAVKGAHGRRAGGEGQFGGIVGRQEIEQPDALAGEQGRQHHGQGVAGRALGQIVVAGADERAIGGAAAQAQLHGGEPLAGPKPLWPGTSL